MHKNSIYISLEKSIRNENMMMAQLMFNDL